MIIVRERFGKMSVKAAEVALSNGNIRITADSKMLLALIENTMSMPTKIKVRIGKKVVKTCPVTSEQNLLATLKQNLYDPYRLMRTKEEFEDSFSARHEAIVPESVLYGEERHELTTRKAG